MIPIVRESRARTEVYGVVKKRTCNLDAGKCGLMKMMVIIYMAKESKEGQTTSQADKVNTIPKIRKINILHTYPVIDRNRFFAKTV